MYCEINSGNVVNEKVALFKVIWIPELRKLLVESGILAVQLKQSETLESKFQYLKSGIPSVESRIQIFLGYLTMGRKKCLIQTPMAGIIYTFTLTVRC